MKVKGTILLRDLQPISPSDFDVARRICEQISKCRGLRATYIAQHNLDPDIMFPPPSWEGDADSTFHALYRIVVQTEYDVINRLRLYTHPFTGYQLTSFDRGIIRTPIVHPIPDTFDKEIEENRPKPDQYVHRYIHMIRHLPKDLVAGPPLKLGEIGWNVGGRAITIDTWRCQVRLNTLFEAGIIDWLRQRAEANSPLNILEIGAGYGALAYYLKSIVPRANYLICDIPEALLFSSIYLAIARPEFQHTIYDGTDESIFVRDNGGYTFIPNFMFDDLVRSGIRIDMAINTNSFVEMSEKQVRHYAHGLKMMLRDTGILFEENWPGPYGKPDNFHCDAKSIIAQFFSYKNTLRPKSAPVIGSWLPGLRETWANRPISDIIDPSLRHFKGKIWTIYWALDSATNLRVYWRELLRRRLPPLVYRLLKGWWYFLRGRKAI
jgi:hypothetical protein